MSSSTTVTLCYVCDTPTNMGCAECRSVYYCSNEHQVEHWALHSELCVGPLFGLGGASRGSKASVPSDYQMSHEIAAGVFGRDGSHVTVYLHAEASDEEPMSAYRTRTSTQRSELSKRLRLAQFEIDEMLQKTTPRKRWNAHKWIKWMRDDRAGAAALTERMSEQKFFTLVSRSERITKSTELAQVLGVSLVEWNATHPNDSTLEGKFRARDGVKDVVVVLIENLPAKEPAMWFSRSDGMHPSLFLGLMPQPSLAE